MGLPELLLRDVGDADGWRTGVAPNPHPREADAVKWSGRPLRAAHNVQITHIGPLAVPVAPQQRLFASPTSFRSCRARMSTIGSFHIPRQVPQSDVSRGSGRARM
jgi:hypothetical protein